MPAPEIEFSVKIRPFGSAGSIVALMLTALAIFGAALLVYDRSPKKSEETKTYADPNRDVVPDGWQIQRGQSGASTNPNADNVPPGWRVIR
jgi:hypothetical protein